MKKPKRMLHVHRLKDKTIITIKAYDDDQDLIAPVFKHYNPTWSSCQRIERLLRYADSYSHHIHSDGISIAGFYYQKESVR